VVLSADRRAELLRYAEHSGSWICEDDYDGEFRNEGKPVEALHALDHGSRVLYVGSFSKTLFPSLRLGYLVVPPGLREDFIKAKWASDFSCSAYEQAALASFIAGGGYDRHLALAIRKLAERRAVLKESLRACCGARVEVCEAGSGMHLLVWINNASRSDGRDIYRRAEEHSLALYPVEPFYEEPPDKAGFLMGFGGMGLQDIRNAVALFSRCVEAVLTGKD
jgi:GntR family transcriptional regulator/MocR family aminotransferase